MAMLHSPDNILWAERCVAAKEHAWARRFIGHFIHHGHVPLIELNAHAALNPRECVVLSDGQNYVVSRQKHRIDHGGFLRIRIPFQALKLHAHQLAVLHDKPLGRVVDYDVNAFFFGIFQLPRRSFKVSTRPPRHHLDVLATHAQR